MARKGKDGCLRMKVSRTEDGKPRPECGVGWLLACFKVARPRRIRSIAAEPQRSGIMGGWITGVHRS